MSNLTLDAIRRMDKPTLTPAEVGAVLGSNPEDIRLQAELEPWRLGFPVSRVRTRTKIPRLPFLSFMEEYQQNRALLQKVAELERRVRQLEQA